MVLLLILFRFHTYDYARHFVSACTRILGLEGTPEGVEDQGRLTRVAAVKIKTDVFMSCVGHILKVYCCHISIVDNSLWTFISHVDYL
jgi:trehalose-6-phosphate synthase